MFMSSNGIIFYTKSYLKSFGMDRKGVGNDRNRQQLAKDMGQQRTS